MQTIQNTIHSLALILKYFQPRETRTMLIIELLTSLVLFISFLDGSHAWRSKECPIDNHDNRESFLCLRPCDYDETSTASKAARDDGFFIVFFPPKSANVSMAGNRVTCGSGFKMLREAGQCLCERPYTPYELEQQRREKCDHAFEICRTVASRAYECNHVIDTCPPMLVRDYCLAGKVFRMRSAKVVYEFCHEFLRLPNDGKRHFLPNV